MLVADLQYAVEAPEGKQQGVCAAHAKGNVDDSGRCQSTCRDSLLSLSDMTLVCVCMHIEGKGRGIEADARAHIRAMASFLSDLGADKPARRILGEVRAPSTPLRNLENP